MSQRNNGGYLGNPLIKADGFVHNFTQEEVSEYLKCSKDPIYFAKKYVKITTLDKGLSEFTPYDYQRDMFQHFNDNRFSIVLACRQSGKSISSIIYILWYVCFHPDKTVAVLANKGATARSLLARITLALEHLPWFLQPGCRELNKGSIGFSNNSKILAAATSASSIRGLSVNLLFLDEFAFVENANEFYTSTYPVITAGTETKVIITSTANGVGNLYYKIYEGAVQGLNDFKAFRVDWWDVPGRDEEWKRMTIANTSELQFEQEFGNNFIGTSNTLISSNAILGLQARSPSRKSTKGVCYYENPIKDETYIMTVDVSKGRGQDYSTFNVVKITENGYFQVATYRDNIISPLILPDIVVSVAKEYNDALILVESNDVGQVVCNAIYYEYEYENLFVESTVKSSGIGVTMTKKIKRIGCSNLKDLIEMNKLSVIDNDTISELSTFEVRGSSYQASQGNHDDLIMNLVLFSWFVSSEAFGNIATKDLKQMLFNHSIQEAEEDLAPIGIIQEDRARGFTVYDDLAQAQREFRNL